jgi:hypothetical protein
VAGASGAGDDFEVGRTNESEERSLLVAINGDPDGYQADFVLAVSVAGNAILTKSWSGVDAIHATGTEELPTGGAIGTIPEGNGVVARGLNGVVGYVHAAPRDRNDERAVHAGVLGVGTTASPGVFGRGANGVVGYSDGAARDIAWEAAEASGVCGQALGVGVRGKGDSGGVLGESSSSAGVTGASDLGPGVDGRSNDGIGVLGQAGRGDGVTGISDEGIGGVFESRRSAQAWLLPREIDDLGPASVVTPTAFLSKEGSLPLPKAGRRGQLLMVADASDHASLWLCISDGPPARWAQILTGPALPGTL